jgi:Uma2 family endonuclease
MTLPIAKMSAAEYLAWEAVQTERHMFVFGETFAMAGGTKGHNEAAGGVYIALRLHLKGTPCRTYIGDVRLSVSDAKAYFYPDVLVTCDNDGVQDPDPTTTTAPKLLVEVLSPSTASFDRGQKFTFYRTLPSLEEYVLIDPDLRTVEVFRKNGNGLWELHFSDADHPSVNLQSVGWSGVIGDLLE